jgi:hypothetical protein
VIDQSQQPPTCFVFGPIGLNAGWLTDLCGDLDVVEIRASALTVG